MEYFRERRKERDRDIEEEEEAHERRKLEKKLREKEAAYQEVRFCEAYCMIFDKKFLYIKNFS